MVEAYVYVIVGFLGLAVGSFLNVVVLRGEREESLMGRSHCTTCARTLTWYELVPVFSYLMQRGRCRGCHTRISLQYPLVELATAATFLILATRYLTNPVLVPAAPFLPSTFYFLLHTSVWSLLIAIFVYDLRTKLIPDTLSYAFAALALLGSLTAYDPSVQPLYFLLATFYPGLVLALPFYLLWEFSNGTWMGLGDAKLAVGIGWYLGLSQGGAAVVLAFWVGAAVSLLSIAFSRVRARLFYGHETRGVLTMRSEVPFGPYLIVGTALASLFGIEFIHLFVV